MPASIELLIEPHLRDLGGFSVRRLLPSGSRQMVGPFIFLDHVGPVEFSPGDGVNVRPHPHIGLATLTYLFSGTIVHRDSLGCVQAIEPGDVNWMIAGRGIVHSERTPPGVRADGSDIHGLQTWLALPGEFEDTGPSFAHHPGSTLPAVELPGVSMRVLAGRAFGRRSPVQVYTDTLYVAIDMMPGSRLDVPAEHQERAIYVVDGVISVSGDPMSVGTLGVLARDADAAVLAHSPAKLMLLGGEKADGPRFIWWNFVSSSEHRIERAKQQWRDQLFGGIPGETDFIPLPE